MKTKNEPNSIHNREMRANDEEYARPAPVPETSSLSEVRAASRECTACHLYKHATQTVFGEGPKGAPIMLVGEQPGDYEDVAGKPFVGPAGKIMDQALEEAGIDRSHVYVTNAVKHFNGSRGASVESTRNQTPAKSQLAGHGLRRSCVW
jgi:DNA polymerase